MAVTTAATAPTKRHWDASHGIAQTLVRDGMDVNELGKAIAYLRASVNQMRAENQDRGETEDQAVETEVGKRFFSYLTTLAKQGRSIGHSKRTAGYYANLEATCTDYLKEHYETQPEVMLAILGWAMRLMRYYDQAGPIGEIVAPPQESERQLEVAQIYESQTIEVGQTLDAVVMAIKGNKVTYQLLGSIKLTQKEPKKAENLSPDQTVQVGVQTLKEDGSIKKIKLLS